MGHIHCFLVSRLISASVSEESWLLYEFPLKIINILRDINGNNSGCEQYDCRQSEWFQGCVPSLALFPVVLYWVTRKAMRHWRPTESVWSLTARLEDCHFADNIALLLHSQIDRADQTAKSLAFRVHSDKTIWKEDTWLAEDQKPCRRFCWWIMLHLKSYLNEGSLALLPSKWHVTPLSFLTVLSHPPPSHPPIAPSYSLSRSVVSKR